MALSPDSCFRVVAAAIPPPASELEVLDQLSEIITGLTLYNEEGPSILYRNSDNDQDIREAVYRFDGRPYQEIFKTGFRPRPPNDPEDWARYYNLERFVNDGGSPGNEMPAEPSVFISTTRSSKWRPTVTADCIFYRYEIFAPGGIDVELTLRHRNDYPNQQEIAFPGGICPQYIRSARQYIVLVTRGSRYPTSYTPVDPNIYVNPNFNPDPNRPPIRLRKPRRTAGGNVIRV